jgi:hypothetical protein
MSKAYIASIIVGLIIFIIIYIALNKNVEKFVDGIDDNVVNSASGVNNTAVTAASGTSTVVTAASGTSTAVTAASGTSTAVTAASTAATAASTAATSSGTSTAATAATSSTPATASGTSTNSNVTGMLNSLQSSLTSISSGNIPSDFKYIEDITKIPNNSELLLYSTSFSEKTNYNKQIDTYIPSSQRWNNFIHDEQSFFILTNKPLQHSIKPPAGLPLKDTKLEGIRSDEINKSDYLLKSFTAVFFLNFNDITFEESSDVIEILSISLEAPNYVRLTLEKNISNPSDVYIYTHVGENNTTNKSGISVPKSTLISNTGVIISFVYQETSTSASVLRKLYINKLTGDTPSHVSNSYTVNTPLVLGNTRMVINKYTTLNANIFAFMYYSKALTVAEHNIIVDYLNNQKSGIDSVAATIQALSQIRINEISQLIESQTNATTSVREELNRCIAEKNAIAPAPMIIPEFRYKVAMNGSIPVTPEEIRNWRFLNIEERLTTETPTPTSTSSPSPSPASSIIQSASSTAQSSFPFNIKIPFLSNIVAKAF